MPESLGRSIAISVILIIFSLTLRIYYKTGVAVLVLTCPQCFGFESVFEGVYTERGAPEDMRNRIEEILNESKKRIVAFYGGGLNAPATFFVSQRNAMA